MADKSLTAPQDEASERPHGRIQTADRSPLLNMAPEDVCQLLRDHDMHGREKENRSGVDALIIRQDITVRLALDNAQMALWSARALKLITEAHDGMFNVETIEAAGYAHDMLTSIAAGHLAVVGEGFRQESIEMRT